MHDIIRYATLTTTHDFVLRGHIFHLGWENMTSALIADNYIILCVTFLSQSTFLWWTHRDIM